MLMVIINVEMSDNFRRKDKKESRTNEMGFDLKFLFIQFKLLWILTQMLIASTCINRSTELLKS